MLIFGVGRKCISGFWIKVYEISHFPFKNSQLCFISALAGEKLSERETAPGRWPISCPACRAAFSNYGGFGGQSPFEAGSGQSQYPEHGFKVLLIWR
jgi:hypothetical protein